MHGKKKYYKKGGYEGSMSNQADNLMRGGDKIASNLAGVGKPKKKKMDY